MSRLACSIIGLSIILLTSLSAAQWTWTWPVAGDEEVATAEVCPLKYGKLWAYTIEIDDGPRTTGLLAPEFFAQFGFTEAPPGLPGGRKRPVVGSMAVFPYRIGANETYLGYDDLKALVEKGWAVANHSYNHKGRSYGNPPEELSAEQCREELFWSQVILASEAADGRTPTHFVYPNGYQKYGEYLNEFGLVSASLMGGLGGINLNQENTEILFLNRNYLDEGAWTNSYAKGEPMAGFPPDGPVEGDLIIDFTHGIDANPDSANQVRWAQRLKTINDQFGVDGTDEFWSAPTGEIVNYSRAAKVAEVNLAPGRLTVNLPEDHPGSPLTVCLRGIPEMTKIPVPEGGALYRQGTSVWITSPLIGEAEAWRQKPKIEKIYQGPPDRVITLENPAKVAAVQVRQHGAPSELQVDLIAPDGTRSLLGHRDAPPSFVSGTHLFANLPNTPAVLTQGVEISKGSDLKEVVIWALEE